MISLSCRDALFSMLLCLPSAAGAQDRPSDMRPQISISTLASGDADWDWTQARTGYANGNPPVWVTTMSRTAKVGTHGYHDVYVSMSRDRGTTWTAPRPIPQLQRTRRDDGYEVVPGDLWPAWHAATRCVLITGKTFNFEDGTRENIHREQVAYAVLQPVTGKCSRLRTVSLPESDHQGASIIAPNAGCHQRVDLPDGEILLPIRYQRSRSRRIYVTIVARCSFDGERLRYIEHGSEHSIDTGRGLYEPSVVRFEDRYFLTMRADDGAYVTSSTDGLHYAAHRPWLFDDGTPLGSYNTQQHWVVLRDRLFLVYTRRGAGNDHIMRHRAPLFLAEVDPQSLRVLRATERVLVPQNHATLGNSGVCQISDDEAWVTVAEGRVSYGARKGENNRVLLAKIRFP